MPGEYLFELEIEIRNSINEQIPLNFNGVAYTIGFGPQMGPVFERLDQRTEFRRYMVFDDGKRDNLRVGNNDYEVVTERVSWAAIAGKYFAVIALTDNRELTTVLAQQDREGLPVGSQVYVTEPTVAASVIQESYQFYVGPKTSADLDRYDNASDNGWGRSDLDLRSVQERRVLFGWLENILKWILQLIVRGIPNYGIAIIVLTILVKLALWPLMRKSYESNAHMQAVQPKMQELREKFQNDKAKLNEAMAKLYREEGVNPLGGCLPMLAQFPFFLAMYGLFNNHFDLRGAVFIPGWISDLSAPDVIVSFGDFTIPIIGWTALRGLPFIFLATQFISSRLMQSSSSAQSSGQMKLMQYGLPALFFFILYNVPSGLLVYWTFSNVLTAAQQYYYNKYRKKQPPPEKPKRRTKRP
jgi:YidC/Oxa1 family membrane protein insertase